MPRVPILRASFLVGFALTSPLLAGQIDRRQQISDWLIHLGDRQPAARIQAQQNLMSLTPAELPLLRQSVATTHLIPAQAEPLESIVTYVSMRGAMLKDLPVKRQPFLGITMSDEPFEQGDDQEQLADVGVNVENIAIGYVAYRFLQVGDIILSIGRPGAMQATTNFRELRAAVATFAPGDVVSVRLLRGGRLMQQQLTLDVAPISDIEHASLTPAQLQASIEQVRADAQTYWNTQFRPLVDPQGFASADETDAPG